MAVSKKSKKTTPKRQRKAAKSFGGTLAGVLAGLLLGVAAVAGTAWYVMTRASPFHMPHTLARLAENEAPFALPGKPGDKPITKQNFDAYRMPSLGQMQQTGARGNNVAESVPVVAPSLPIPVDNSVVSMNVPVTATSSAARFYLQVGAFENPAEADNMKALLALNGIEATAQRTMLNDGRIVHRVRIGPFNSQEEMVAVRSQLTEAGLTAIPTSQSM